MNPYDDKSPAHPCTDRNINDMRGNGLSISQLTSENNFIKYVRLLSAFSKRYTLILSIYSSALGTNFSEYCANSVMKLGTQLSLFSRYDCAYIAIIDAGELLFESMAPSPDEMLEWKGNIGENSIEVISTGLVSKPVLNSASIIINGENHSPNTRGLNFVLFDSVTKQVIDACNFDICSPRFTCTRPAEKIATLSEYAYDHPGVAIVCVSLSTLPENNRTENEEFVFKTHLIIQSATRNYGSFNYALDNYYSSREEIIETLTPPKSYLDAYGVRRFEDTHTRHVNSPLPKYIHPFRRRGAT